MEYYIEAVTTTEFNSFYFRNCITAARVTLLFGDNIQLCWVESVLISRTLFCPFVEKE
jgi:hypothetical protein